MRAIKFSIALATILAISGCSVFPESAPPEKQVIVKTELVKKKIATVPRPKAVKLNKIKFYVVNEKNYGEFKTKFLKEQGDLVYIAMSVRDYENLSLNLAELDRYIKQQKSVILYYEEAVKPTLDKEKDNDKK